MRAVYLLVVNTPAISSFSNLAPIVDLSVSPCDIMKVPRDLVLLWAATAVAGGRGPFALPFVGAVPTIAAEAVAEELDWTHPRVVGFKDALLSLLAPAGSASDADMGVGDYDVAADVPSHHHHAAGVHEILLEQRQSDGDDGDSDGGEDGEDDDDKKELYLCSNPDFDTTCGEGCMCASVPVTTSPISYGGKPPCGQSRCFLVSTLRNIFQIFFLSVRLKSCLLQARGMKQRRRRRKKKKKGGRYCVEGQARLTWFSWTSSCSPLLAPAGQPAGRVVGQGLLGVELHPVRVSRVPRVVSRQTALSETKGEESFGEKKLRESTPS